MSLGEKSNSLGVSDISPTVKFPFEIPTVSTGGTKRDMGTLALFLLANWFVNGETVLIDGGVSPVETRVFGN